MSPKDLPKTTSCSWNGYIRTVASGESKCCQREDSGGPLWSWGRLRKDSFLSEKASTLVAW